MADKSYKWEYASVGGVVRARIDSGEAIAHLGELDQQKWTVLSCPTDGLEFDKETISLIDTNKDGKIHVAEVVKAAEWLTSLVKDKDLILKGESELALDQINTESEEGQKILASAKSILANLGLEKDSISVSDTADIAKIFANTLFNGDGIVIPESAQDDAALSQTLADAIACCGSVADKSGKAGVDAALTESFYASLADYAAWCDEAENNKKTILPYGDATDRALALSDALKDKVADFFMRCKLIRFNEDATAAVDVTASKIGEIGGGDLNACGEQIAACPLARPTKEAVLPIDAINPAWQAQVSELASIVGIEGSINEDGWAAILASLEPLRAWKAAQKGAAVAGLGIERVKAILKEGRKDDILALIAEDESYRAESEAIDLVGKLLHLYRDFYRFLRNYVVFTDFYGRGGDVKAVFEAGKLYIDERCCNLCLKVTGPGNHAEAANLSGIFLVYCTCTSKVLGKTMDIVAIMTDGKTANLRPGKNAIFYDNDGNDWDAVVTKIVDNPISIKQAFWAPYIKFWNFCVDKINKSAAEKDNKLTESMKSKVDSAEIPAKEEEKKAAQPFDIAKFAGIFAAIGMALGYIGSALTSLALGIKSLPIWQLPLVILAIILLISGPSCFIAWSKLRKRNLGPVLNASGWAINSVIPINIIFGSTLTSVAKYPLIKAKDPFAEKKTPVWVKILIALVFIAAIAAGVYAWLYFVKGVKLF